MPLLKPHQHMWLERRYSAPLIVIAITVLFFSAVISRSFYDGRLDSPLTHDDVNFFIEGIQHLTLLRTKGFLALADDLIHGSLHAPIRTYQAMLAYLMCGINDWAPYVSNIILVFFFFGFSAYLLRDCPTVVLVAALITLVLLPLSSNAFTEFAPEIICSLFTAMGAVLMVRLPVIAAPLRSRFVAGLCFAVGFLGHPSAFPFTAIALMATVGLAFLRDIVWNGRFGQWRAGIAYSLLNVLLSVWLPALYMVPRHGEYVTYFYDALFNHAEAWRWLETSGKVGGRLQHVIFYLFGEGGQFMFGDRLLAYAGIILLGFAAAWWNKNRQLLARLTELGLLAVLFWLVPTLAAFKNYLFAAAFGFLIAFMTVIALRSIYQAGGTKRGALVVAALAFLLLIFYKPSEFYAPNTPESNDAREFAFLAIHEFKTVLRGNAPNPNGMRVYMPNQGAYAPNMLQYYMLKDDPKLDWIFGSNWDERDARRHLDFIHETKQDFVIAGQRHNGLTYSPIAEAAEDAVFAAMWLDPSYMAVDRFYGPNGRAIAIFERRGNFAGWRSVSGIINRTLSPDGERVVPDGLAYLRTFAAQATQAELELGWTDAAPGQKLRVFVNYQKEIELTIDRDAPSSSLNQKINLSRGLNEIALQSDGPLTLRHLWIVPKIDKLIVPENPGISVVSATYGGNCGAPQGNATSELKASCDGKNECAYPVRVETFGDPASRCGKNFTVSFFCPIDTNLRHEELSPEAGFGKVVDLHCPPPSTGPAKEGGAQP